MGFGGVSRAGSVDDDETRALSLLRAASDQEGCARRISELQAATNAHATALAEAQRVKAEAAAERRTADEVIAKAADLAAEHQRRVEAFQRDVSDREARLTGREQAVARREQEEKTKAERLATAQATYNTLLDRMHAFLRAAEPGRG